MRQFVTTTLLCLSLLIASNAFAGRRTITVVHRADRVEIEGGWVARITGITAPEPGTLLGGEGLAFTRNAVEGKSVAFSSWTTDNTAAGIVHDAEGLPFATVEYGDPPLDLGAELLKRGLARVDEEHLPEYVEHYREIEAKAKAAGIGLWKQTD